MGSYGGLYATYHLLGEPETTIDWTIHLGKFLVTSDDSQISCVI